MASTFKLDSIDIISNDSATQSWGSAVAGLGYTFHNRFVFYTGETTNNWNGSAGTESHTYTKSTGTTAVMVYCTAGGGGGGGPGNSDDTSGSGGAGGTAIKFIKGTTTDGSSPFSGMSTVTVTTGKGGRGGGVDGSSSDSHRYANGTFGGTS